MKIRAVLFDLDDTLFDHRGASNEGLRAVRKSYPSVLGEAPFERIEEVYNHLLEELHLEYLAGVKSGREAMLERFERLFCEFGAEASSEKVEEAAGIYRSAYNLARGPLPGALELVDALGKKVTVGIVTNNSLEGQIAKLKLLGLESLVPRMTVSEEVGHTKPDPRIFEMALERIDASAEETVMVGNAWESDILGATGAGIASVWLNRFDEKNPDPDRAVEIRSLEPTEKVAEMVLNAAVLKTV